MKTGIYDIEWNDYLAIDALNQSRLKKILVAPRLFDSDEKEETTSLSTGKILHTFLEHKSLSEFACMPKTDRRTKAGKEFAAQFEEDNQGKIVISSIQYELITRLAEGFNNHPHAAKILHNSKPEKTAISKLGNLMCKGRFDLLQEDLELIVDVKTTRRNTKREFENDCVTHGYQFQLAFYERLYQTISGSRPTMAIITFETQPPYEVSLYYPDDDFMQYGRDKMTEAFDKFKRCKELGYFPIKQEDGVGETLSLPWSKRN